MSGRRNPRNLPTPAYSGHGVPRDLRLPALSQGTRTFHNGITVATDLKASEYADVWKAGYALAIFLEHVMAGEVKGSRVLELGAGVGYTGLTAAVLGAARVVMTDQRALMAVLQANVQRALQVGTVRADVAVAVKEMDWNSQSQVGAVAAEGFDLVLASDVVYEEDGVETFLAAAEAVCRANQGTNLVLAQQARPRQTELTEDFFARARREGWEVEEVTHLHDGLASLLVREEIAIWRFALP